MVRVCLLGDLRVELDGARIELASLSRRARVLLAILALERRVHGRSELAGRLWPDVREESARVSLRTALSQLRRALGPAAALVVRVERDAAVVLGPDVRTDVEEVEQLLAAGEPEVALERCSAHLLAGLDDDWVLERRDDLRERIAGALEVAADAAEAAGDLQGAVRLTRHIVALDPLAERAHRELIRRLAATGDHGAALATYEHLRERLAEELQIAPSVDTRTLAERLRGEDAARFGRRRLPSVPNRTIGREREVAAVCARLRDRGGRMVTLTGPGGVGKTRLAVEIAQRLEEDFTHGAWFVRLAEIRFPKDIACAVVQALDIVPLVGEAPAATVERFLSAKRLLLVLDNLEHILDGAPFIASLLAGCPELTILATSREPLGLQAEERFRVAPLALPPVVTPEDVEALADVDAIALFCERARAHDPTFDVGVDPGAVAEICRRLDGLPLAIELAAARCGLLSAGEIADRLHGALSVPGAGARDAPARHQTLRATVDWSHGLLGEDEKAVFARFAVFVGGAAIDAAETITGADLTTLERLVSKSLLVRRHAPGTPTRLRMLETIRAYATERLASCDERDAVCESHFRYYLALAQRDGSERALWGPHGKEHLARLETDIDNAYGALRWALERREPEAALEMVVALGPYWLMRVRNTDAVESIDGALTLDGAQRVSALRVRALAVKTIALWRLGRRAEQVAAMAEAEAIARELGDPALISETLQPRVDDEIVASGGRRVDVADVLADEALHWASVAGDEWLIAKATLEKARASANLDELRERVERAASLLEQVGNVYQLAGLLAAAVYQALCMGGDRYARELVDRALPVVHALGSPFMWLLLRGNAGLAALLTGDTAAAEDAFREELSLCREHVVLSFLDEPLMGLAAVAAVRGDVRRAGRLVGAAAAHRYDHGENPIDERLDTFFAPARSRCGAEAWDEAARAGRGLSYREAVAYALEEPAVPVRA